MIIDLLDHRGGFCLRVGERGASRGDIVISVRGVGGATLRFFFSFLPLRGLESSDESSTEDELSSPSCLGPFNPRLVAWLPDPTNVLSRSVMLIIFSKLVKFRFTVFKS